MNTDRINVFHITDCYGRIVPVPDHFIFDLFIAPDTFFHKHFPYRRKFQGVFQLFRALLGSIRKAAACAAQGERRTQDDRITDFFCRFQSFFQFVYCHGRKHRFPQGFAQFFEKFPVLRPLDGTAVRTQEFHLALFQYPFLFKLHRKVQAGLSADSRQNRIRPFIPDNLRNVLQRQGLHVYLIRHGSIRHDGGRIGIAQDHLIPFLFQGKAGLCSRVVELSRLADHNRAGADDQHFPDISSFRHDPRPPPSS